MSIFIFLLSLPYIIDFSIKIKYNKFIKLIFNQNDMREYSSSEQTLRAEKTREEKERQELRDRIKKWALKMIVFIERGAEEGKNQKPRAEWEFFANMPKYSEDETNHLLLEASKLGIKFSDDSARTIGNLESLIRDIDNIKIAMQDELEEKVKNAHESKDARDKIINWAREMINLIETVAKAKNIQIPRTQLGAFKVIGGNSYIDAVANDRLIYYLSLAKKLGIKLENSQLTIADLETLIQDIDNAAMPNVPEKKPKV